MTRAPAPGDAPPRPAQTEPTQTPPAETEPAKTWRDHVHVGRDGWLFVTSGANSLDGPASRSFHTTYQIECWRGLLLARRRRLARLGIAYRHVVVPEKSTVHDEYLDGIRHDLALSPAHRLTRGWPRRPEPWHRAGGLLDAWRLRQVCIDLVGPLRAAKARRTEKAGGTDALYYRTDSHWSYPGCHLAYRRICRALGARPRADLADRPFREAFYQGDLGQHLDPPRGETARRYERQRHAVRRYANPIVAAREAGGLADTLHTGSHVVWVNPAATDRRRLVLFGDSCAHFDASMLTILLAETFAEVHFLWSTSLDWAYVERARPDIVLTEIAERFMLRVPDDRFDVLAYAETRYGAELARYRAGRDGARDGRRGGAEDVAEEGAEEGACTPAAQGL